MKNFESLSIEEIKSTNGGCQLEPCPDQYPPFPFPFPGGTGPTYPDYPDTDTIISF